MPINLQCGACGKKLRAPDRAAGKTAKCPGCGARVRVPTVDENAETYSLAMPPPQPTDAPIKPPRSHSHIASTLEFSGTVLSGRYLPREALEARRLAESSSRAWQRHLYWLFAATLLPLVFHTLLSKETLLERIRTTLQHHPEITARLNLLVNEIRKQDAAIPEDVLFLVFRREIAEALPEKKLDGAMLSVDSRAHWLLGLGAALLFAVLIVVLFENGDASLLQALVIGLITGTAGVLLLLAFQWMAHSARVRLWFGRNVIFFILLIIRFIGWSYCVADDPESNVLISFIGFTCGAGLCEEICKLLPLILIVVSGDKPLDWRGALILGLASGAGFGIAEGIIYSGRSYNGFCSGEIYAVRFFSCVGLHAIWCGACGIMLCRRQGDVSFEISEGDFWLTTLLIVAIPAVLHGLYDTLLTKEMPVSALMVAAASLVWLAWLIETSHRGTPRKRRRVVRRA